MKPEKQLYQWDVNQYLTGINPAAQYVDYQMGNEVIRIKSDGTRCRIPDEVLQTYGGKTCYERYTDGTYRAYSFTVLYSPKPPDYVYTPEERTTFEALTARVDSAIEEIKRRADSGEFTPVKGVDYFTDAEKNEMMESVSSGAVGEFRKVVDTATTEYNDNAAEKLTTYDTNAEQHTTDYNRNAAEKLEAYNQNHAAKVAEYNQNAETKTAEFDANAAAMQTEVDRLRGECDQLAAENRKQENRISALMKLNKGQTYDILPEEGETASRTAPSGAKYVSVDKVGGHSEVVDGEIISSQTDRVDVARADGTTSQQITTGFPELKSAGTAHDEIDMDGEKVHRKIKSVRIDGDSPIYHVSVDTDANCCRIVFKNQLTPGIIGSKNEKVKSNIISDRLATISHSDYWNNSLRASGINVFESLQAVCFRLHDRTDIDTNEKAKAWLAENPTTVFYEIESEEVTDVTIPEPLQEWIPVEPGGTVTFKNADESKQLAVPNAVSWVRKLNEVE